nr:uncharacterized protein LOC104099626 [Nicotiana tomentosiformis]
MLKKSSLRSILEVLIHVKGTHLWLAYSGKLELHSPPPPPPPLFFDYLLSGVSFSFSSEVDMQKLESKREISRCEKGMAIEIPVAALYEGSPSDQQCDQCSCSLHWSF